MSEFDVWLLLESRAAEVLEQGSGQEESVEAEVALREWIEPRLLRPDCESSSPLESAGF
jgi:hypothetical protein